MLGRKRQFSDEAFLETPLTKKLCIGAQPGMADRIAEEHKMILIKNENSKLAAENRILREGLKAMQHRLASCKCDQIAPMNDVIVKQGRRISELEHLVVSLGIRLRAQEGGIDPASKWDGRPGGDGHVF